MEDVGAKSISGVLDPLFGDRSVLEANFMDIFIASAHFPMLIEVGFCQPLGYFGEIDDVLIPGVGGGHCQVNTCFLCAGDVLTLLFGKG